MHNTPDAARAASLVQYGKVVVLILLVRVLLCVCVLAAMIVARPPFDHATYIAVYRGNYGHLPSAPPNLGTRLAAWDAAHYLSIASEGYSAHGPDRAFYPLWPWLIRASAAVTGAPPLLAALVAANLLAIAGLLLLYDYVRRCCGPRAGLATLLCLLVYPSAFFFYLAYSEALFLLLSVLLFWALERRRLVLALFCSAALPLARPLGLFGAVPPLIEGVRRWRSPRAALLLVPALVGYSGYFLLMWATTGNALAGFQIQSHFVAAPSLLHALSPGQLLADFARVHGFHGYLDSPIDRLCFVAFVLACVALVRRYGERPEWWMYALLMGLVPAISTRFMSFGRYLDVVFPVFIVLGVVVQRSRPSAWYVAALGLAGCGLFATQVALALRYFSYSWAG